ncbi:autotransporter strand-loop-strand O-heptosyltransferase, partial [Salmonella enterica subsp. enterica serovar Kintambo]|nr:autotransporter strand-loop-strand O-heptosyltransferase [Salmonella enterica subsp. enterica serovar Kintambo]
MSFIQSSDKPLIKATNGVLYDFNDGARVLLPAGSWHVKLIDEDSGNILFSCDSNEGWVTST